MVEEALIRSSDLSSSILQTSLFDQGRILKYQHSGCLEHRRQSETSFGGIPCLIVVRLAKPL
jgi:hypothetical protein